MKSVAILYIALGRYSVFWRDFFLSAEKHFLPDCQKTYFVFTDNHNIEFEEKENVLKIPQDSLGWPYATMMRFHIFLGQEEKLKNFDYIFFFNGNMEFVDTVGEEILPTDKNNGLVMGQHPGFYNKPNTEFCYDRNPQSSSYIPEGEGKFYVQGCLNGGTSAAYLDLCRYCRNALQTDLDNNIIPLWHDESILNKYILNKNPLIMPCNYLYPENWKLPHKFSHKKIIQRDKKNPKYGGIDWLRNKIDKDKENFDVVICAKKEDLVNIGKTVAMLRKNLTFKDVVIISNERPDDIKEPFIKFISENDVLSGLSYNDIKNYFESRSVAPARIGWYLQQFIKMYYAFICPDKHYLLWDADTLMLNKIDFFDENNKIYFDNSRIWEDKVFNTTVEKLLGYPKTRKETYIVEHMMIKCDRMRELVTNIAARGKTGTATFWQAILDNISNEDLTYGGFSEFEVIGTFMEHNYKDEINFRPLRSCRNIANLVGGKLDKFDLIYYRRKFDFITLEAGHKLKTSGLTRLKNKIRNILWCTLHFRFRFK